MKKRFLSALLAMAIMITSVFLLTVSITAESDGSTAAEETNKETGTALETLTEVSIDKTGAIAPAIVNNRKAEIAGGTWVTIYSEATICGTESMYVELYCGNELLATTTLVDNDKALLNGQVTSVTYHFFLEGSDDWWKTEWVGNNPIANKVPNKVALYVDGVKTGENEVFMSNSNDNLGDSNVAYNFGDLEGVKVAEVNGTYYESFQDAVNASTEKQTVNLLGSITEEMVTVTAGKNVIIDFGGNTLYGSMLVEKGATADIKNGYISQADVVAGIEVQGVAALTDMTITSARHAIRVDGLNTEGTSLTVNSGTYQSNAPTGWSAHTINAGEGSAVTINGGTFIGAGVANAGGTGNCVMVKDNTTAVEIKAGIFYGSNGPEGVISPAEKLTISGGSFGTWSYDNYLADGYAAVEVDNSIEGTTFKVVVEVIELTHWIQIADTEWYNDNDTEFTLETAEELAGLAALVNGGNNFSGKTIKLGANIDLAGLAWTPIGNGSVHFAGSFDGKNFTVSNLSVNEPTSSYKALFGQMKGSSESSYPFIANLTLTNVNVIGKNYVAGLVADAFCIDIINCHVNGDIYILNVENNNYTGAIAGHSYANIRDCSVKDTGIDGNGIIQGCYSGGIAGWTGEGKYLIENCTVENIDFVEESGTIVGLINAGVIIKDCTAKNCTINSNTGSGLGYTGLIAGDNRSYAAVPNFILNCTLENVTGMVTVSGASQELTQLVPAKDTTFVGKDVVINDSRKIVSGTFTMFSEAIAANVLADGSTYAKNDDGTFTVNEAPATSWSGTGTDVDPYVITDVAGLVELADRVNAGENFAGCYFVLANDIDLAGTPWVGIGIYSETTVGTAFSGTFDGQGNKISGVTFANTGSNKYRGFFNQLYRATIKNVTIETNGFGYTADQIASMPVSMGGAVIAGHAIGSTIENCIAEGTFVGTHNVAGIVVLIQGSTVKNCINKANLTNNYSKLAGIVNFSQHKGVDADNKASLIEGCVNMGTVTSVASGTNGVGGIIGWIGYGSYGADANSAYAVTIKNCENKGDVTGTSSAKLGQIVGSAESYIVDGGSNKGLVTTYGIGDNNSYFVYAIVEGGVATYVTTLEAGKTYLVTAPNAKAIIVLEADEFIAFDTSLASVDVSGITVSEKATLEVITEGHITTYKAELLPVASVNGVEYGTLQSAIDAANAGDKIVLLSNITEAMVTVKAGKNVEIDFCGYTLNGSMLVEKGATADIKNGTIYQTASVAGIEVQGVATLTEMNITSDGRHAIRVDGLNTEGTLLTVISGTYTTNAPLTTSAYAVNAGEKSTVIIKGGKFVGNGGGQGAFIVKSEDTLVTIEGGEFYNGNAIIMQVVNSTVITGGIYGGNGGVRPATGYVLVQDGDVYEVVVATELKSSNIILGSDIGVNLYYSINKYVLADEGAYLKVTLPNGKVEEIAVGDAIWVEELGLYKFSLNIAVKEMTAEIKAQFITTDESYDEETYTVEKYALTIAKNESGEFSAEAVALAKALLNYGAAAQNYFGYKTDALANRGLEEGDKTVPTLNAAVLENYKSTVVGGSINGVKHVAVSTVWETNMVIRHYFEITEGTAVTVTLNGESYTLKDDVKTGYYYVDISGIYPTNMDEVFTLTINDTLEVSYSVYAYIYDVIETYKNQTTDAAKAGAVAAYYYSQAAKAYADAEAGTNN